jgi:hypothetical protein
VRVIVTDLLEVVGLVLLVAALAVWAWTLAPAAGLAVAGVGLVGVSAVLAWAGRRP